MRPSNSERTPCRLASNSARPDVMAISSRSTASCFWLSAVSLRSTHAATSCTSWLPPPLASSAMPTSRRRSKASTSLRSRRSSAAASSRSSEPRRSALRRSSASASSMLACLCWCSCSSCSRAFVPCRVCSSRAPLRLSTCDRASSPAPRRCCPASCAASCAAATAAFRRASSSEMPSTTAKSLACASATARASASTRSATSRAVMESCREPESSLSSSPGRTCCNRASTCKSIQARSCMP
mmetsp:Transcript_2948/g.7351  ORF Transcript_2948/g.7351 Transcript_2948/m.7351 type:complete len:241 (+) Transcript_2948:271-993(+)